MKTGRETVVIPIEEIDKIIFSRRSRSPPLLPLAKTSWGCEEANIHGEDRLVIGKLNSC
jgi:hypothetical protein